MRSSTPGKASRLEPINAARSANQPHMLPQPSVSLRAASEVAPPDLHDLKAYIDKIEAKGKRYIWATEVSSSIMLTPFDQGLAAVADLINVAYDEASNSITLEVDVVDKPNTITEFEIHHHQTRDVRFAHYHYKTPQGVDINAPALLQSLKAADYKVKGLHVWAKGHSPFCYHVQLSASPSASVPVGSQVNVSITNIQFDSDACGSNACPGQGNMTLTVVQDGVRGNITLTEDGALVDVGLQGPAFPAAVSEPSRDNSKHQASAVKQSFQAKTVSGEAWVLVGVAGEGPIIFGVDFITSSLDYEAEPVFEVNAITLRGLPPLPPPASTPPVAKLLLHPTKAYRHVHDPITLTVKALDTAGLPVANATVSFSAFGDCVTTSDTVVSNTNAAGVVDIKLSSHKPGAVALVAAAVNAQGAAIFSEPANIIFFEDHRYVEEREPEYYGPEHYGRDAESYAKAAAQRAVQQLGTTASSVSV